MNNILRSVRTHALHVFVRKMRKCEKPVQTRVTFVEIPRLQIDSAQKNDENNGNNKQKKYISCQRDIPCRRISFYVAFGMCVDGYEKWQCKMEFSLNIKECLVWRRFDGLIACVHAWLCAIDNRYLLSTADNDATAITLIPLHSRRCHRRSHFRARDAFFLYNGKTKSAQSSYFIGTFFPSPRQPCKILLWWWWLLLLLFLR